MKKICVRMPNWLGDAVMGTPILEDIKRALPECELHVLCHNAIKTLLEETPFIDSFITFSNDKKRTKEEKERVYTELQRRSFDAGILLTRSFSSAWWFFRGKVARRIGFKDHYRTPLLTEALDIPANEETEHQVITYKRLLAPLGIPESSTSPRLYLSNSELDACKKLLLQYGVESSHLVIGINPGAAFGSAKCWPKERFKELTARLTQHPDVRVVYFGDNATQSLVDEITKPFGHQVVNLAGKTTLRSFTALLSLTNCLVTNDSGPMHLASALSTPLVALFGSTNAIKTGPYNGGTVIYKQTLCSPCYLRTCPIDFRCMTSITVDDVLSAITTTVKHDARLCR